MYKFDDSIPSAPAKDYMDVGIHENVELIGSDYRVSKNNSKFIELIFQNKFGEKLTHTEWEPSDDDADKLKDKILNQVTRFKYILSAIAPGEALSFEFDSFEDFANKILAFIKAKVSADNKVRIKVVYNNKNYTTLPNYLKIPWIESMNIPKAESRISIIERIDKMVKSTPTTMVTDENPFNSDIPQTNAPTPSSEVPF